MTVTTSPASLDTLLYKYAALAPPSSLDISPELPFTEVHDFLLNSILFNTHLQTYPPSDHYKRSFWKWAIQRLESMVADEDVEIDPRIYHQYLSNLTHSSQGPPTPSYVTYYWNANLVDDVQRTTLLESRTIIESGTTGLRSWNASFVLAHYLIDHPELVANGKRVLELGAGAGFLATIVASVQLINAQPGTLYMTDANQRVLERCSRNMNLPCNRSSSHPALNFHGLDWLDALDPMQAASLKNFVEREARPDLVLGADLVYDPSLIRPLIAVIELALNPRGESVPETCALVAVTVRNDQTIREFLRTAQKHLTIEEIHFIPKGKRLDVSEGITDVKIFKLTRQYTKYILAQDPSGIMTV